MARTFISINSKSYFNKNDRTIIYFLDIKQFEFDDISIKNFSRNATNNDIHDIAFAFLDSINIDASKIPFNDVISIIKITNINAKNNDRIKRLIIETVENRQKQTKIFIYINIDHISDMRYETITKSRLELILFTCNDIIKLINAKSTHPHLNEKCASVLSSKTGNISLDIKLRYEFLTNTLKQDKNNVIHVDFHPHTKENIKIILDRISHLFVGA